MIGRWHVDAMAVDPDDPLLTPPATQRSADRVTAAREGDQVDVVVGGRAVDVADLYAVVAASCGALTNVTGSSLIPPKKPFNTANPRMRVS